MVLKEKKFREHLKAVNWEQYKDTFVALHCSTDTIIPVWAYMILTKYHWPFHNFKIEKHAHENSTIKSIHLFWNGFV